MKTDMGLILEGLRQGKKLKSTNESFDDASVQEFLKNNKLKKGESVWNIRVEERPITDPILKKDKITHVFGHPFSTLLIAKTQKEAEDLALEYAANELDTEEKYLIVKEIKKVK
jgi:hypothetical protein